MKKQHGVATVEFSLIALLFIIILLGIIEFGRALYVYNTLVEATRRGARVAAVCPITDSGRDQIRRITIFDLADGTGTPMLGLTQANIIVSYFKSDMTAIVPSPPLTLPQYDTAATAFVRVEIDQGANRFLHQLIIPGLSTIFQVPAIRTTLPSESLGRVSSANPVTKRCCYNVCQTV